MQLRVAGGALVNDMDAQIVLLHLGSGRDAAISLGELAESLNWTRRRVEKAVRALRLDGKPISSDGTGCWYADLADMEATERSLHHRLVSQYLTLREHRATLRRMRNAQVKQLELAL